MKPEKILTAMALLIGIGTRGAFPTSIPESLRAATPAERVAATDAPDDKPDELSDPDEQIRALLERIYLDTGGGDLRFKKSWSLKRLLAQRGPAVRYENGRLSLDLSYHHLDGKLDLAGCTALVSLMCSDNCLTRLTLPKDVRRLFQLRCTGNPLCMEIPEAFDRLRIFQHDVRYEYRTRPDPTTGEMRTVATDTGRGWWYAGEPEKGAHKR